ncbi:MAG TPA: MFS transporter [Acidimicrobiia bacterium]|nr:MFS transporter [Acidimicrobiia bacterium]
MSADQPAPFIPATPDEPVVPPTPWRVFGTKAYFRLWLAQVISSTGDWIGLIAILAIAARVSDNSGAAVSLVMVARVVPGFFLGTVGGVVIDRFDRRRVMVTCDVLRASLLLLLPFVDTLLGLVMISFGLEILTLLWGPAKDASVPHLVDQSQLASANSLSLIASYATFPVATIAFSLLAALSGWLGTFHALSSLRVDQEVLALALDACTFLVSAMIVFRLPIPHDRERHSERVDFTQSIRDIKEGLHFIATHPRVRGVIVGLGLGLIGAGAMIPLGPAFAKQGLNGDSATFGVLMTALGMGAAVGVVLLLVFQKWLQREAVFDYGIMGTGLLLIFAVSLSSLFPAALMVGFVGAFAGTSYVTGFTVLQETVHDDLRGRTFATLYTVIRMCLLMSLVISPLWADFWTWFVGLFPGDRVIEFGDTSYAFPGVRIALWSGGLITFFAGFWARRSWKQAQRTEVAT